MYRIHEGKTSILFYGMLKRKVGKAQGIIKLFLCHLILRIMLILKINAELNRIIIKHCRHDRDCFSFTEELDEMNMTTTYIDFAPRTSLLDLIGHFLAVLQRFRLCKALAVG
jgi:hypothetical protein